MSWKLFPDPTVKLYIVLLPVLEFKNHNSQLSLLSLQLFSQYFIITSHGTKQWY